MRRNGKEAAMEEQPKSNLAIDENCTVLHGKTKDGKTNVVAIGALKVVIAKDASQLWFAQGLDIDYAAEGTSIEDVKKNFVNGLVATIDLHLKAYADLSNVLKPAPQEVWQEMFYGPLMGQKTTVAKKYYQISVHSTDHVQQMAYFENIEYFELALAA
jgi:hypothetical protein